MHRSTKKRIERVAKGICVRCGYNKATKTKCCDPCAEKHRAEAIAHHRNLKTQIIEAYGGECECCGEEDYRFLTVDHKKGGGIAHRKAIGKTKTTRFYHWIRDQGFPDEFRILCFNCNSGRSVNGGICPHKDPLN